MIDLTYFYIYFSSCFFIFLHFCLNVNFSSYIFFEFLDKQVASNVAPSTATISVTHNFLFKMAYGGMHCFKPMEVMWPCTSNALMGSLLLHDICNEDGPNRGATSLSETDDHFTNP